MIDIAASILAGSTIIAAYGWRRSIEVAKSEAGWRAHWEARSAGLDTALAKCQTDYATERRWRIEANDSNMRLADQVCALQARLQRIRDIPNNGKKPNGGLSKAQRIAGAE